MRKLFFGFGATAALSVLSLQACSSSDTTPTPPTGCVPNQPTVCECPGGKTSTGVTKCVAGDSRVYVACECDPSTSSTATSSTSTGGGTGGSGGMGPVCKQNESVCSDKCVDLMGDNANCGMCGTKCPTGTSCLTGKCECLKAGQEYCGDTCLDTSTDAKNCGGCGHDCLGGGCFGGVCGNTKIAEGQDEPYGLAVDATYVYWTSAGVKNSVYRKKLADASMPELIANNQKLPRELALATDPKYTGTVWVNAGLADQGAAIQGAKALLMPTALATSAKDGLQAVTVVGKNVFWLNAKLGELWSADLTATVDTTNVKLASALSQPWDLAADASFVYYTTYNGGDVRRVGAAGGTQKVLVKGLGNPTGIAIDDTYAYYATENTGEIARVIQDGSKAPETIATMQLKPAHVTVDGGFVYWTNYGTTDTDGSVVKAPVAGGKPVVLAAGQNKPYQIATDDKYVYWTTFGGNTIMKAPK